MAKVKKGVCYCPDAEANSVYITGRCDFFMKNDYNAISSGRYSIAVNAVVANDSVVGSKIVFTLMFYSDSDPLKEKKKRVEFYKDFKVHNCNISEIFALFEQPCKLKGLNITDYTIDHIYVRLCALYDLKTAKVVMDGAHRFLFVASNCFLNAYIDPISTFKGVYGNIKFWVHGLNSSLDSSHTAYDTLINNAQHYERIAIGGIREPSKYKELFSIPNNLKSGFYNSELMWNMTEKYTDTYIKEQVWGEYVDL